ncbi:MAG TPA: hypothetical protein VMT88_09975 [Actinomycetes bacterium]|nr:hypothetical protein [Actinomycetes bacterium]
MTDNDVLSSEAAAETPRGGPARWPIVAGGCALVLVAATAGYALGQSGDHNSPVQAPISLENKGSAIGDEGVPGVMGGPGMLNSAGNRVGSTIMPYGFGRTVFIASGLSDAGSSSKAWTYDPSQVFSRQTAQQAADVLALNDSPTLVNGVWTVGSNDGSGPTLQLAPDGQAMLNYWDASIYGYACPGNPGGIVEPNQGPDGSVSGSSGSSGSGVAEPQIMTGTSPSKDCTNEQSDLISGDAAISRLKGLMTDLGVETSDYEFQAMDGSPNPAYVTAYEVVDGQRTGAMWSASFAGRDVQSLSGGLAPLASLGSYDVVSPTVAVDRLADPRYGAGYYGGPMPYAGAMEGRPMMKMGEGDNPVPPDSPVAAPTPTLPPTVEPGDSFDWPVQEVTITKARLGLAMYTQSDGAAVLLPTYELSGDDGSTWNAVAVVDSSLDFGN